MDLVVKESLGLAYNFPFTGIHRTTGACKPDTFAGLLSCRGGRRFSNKLIGNCRKSLKSPKRGTVYFSGLLKVFKRHIVLWSFYGIWAQFWSHTQLINHTSFIGSRGSTA